MSLYIFLNEDQNCIDIPVFKGTNENGTEIAFKALIILWFYGGISVFARLLQALPSWINW